MSQLADKSEEKPSRLVSLKILVFLFFGALQCLYAYLPVHMEWLGFTRGEVRTVTLIASLVSIIGPLIVGFILDRVAVNRPASYGKWLRVLLFICFIAAGIFFPLLLSIDPEHHQVFHKDQKATFSCNDNGGHLFVNRIDNETCDGVNDSGSLNLFNCTYTCELPENFKYLSDPAVAHHKNHPAFEKLREEPAGSADSPSDEDDYDENRSYNDLPQPEAYIQAPTQAPVINPPHICIDNGLNVNCIVYLDGVVIKLPKVQTTELGNQSERFSDNWCTHPLANFSCHVPERQILWMKHMRLKDNASACVPAVECLIESRNDNANLLKEKRTVVYHEVPYDSYYPLRIIAEIFPIIIHMLLNIALIIATRETSIGRGNVGHQWAFYPIGVLVFSSALGLVNHLIPDTVQPFFVPIIVFSITMFVCAIVVLFSGKSPLTPSDWWWHTKCGMLAIPMSALKRYKWVITAIALSAFILGGLWHVQEAFRHIFTIDLIEWEVANGLRAKTFVYVFGALLAIPLIWNGEKIVDCLGHTNIFILALLSFAFRFAGLYYDSVSHWSTLYEILEPISFYLAWLALLLFLRHLVPKKFLGLGQALLVILFFALGRALGFFFGVSVASEPRHLVALSVSDETARNLTVADLQNIHSVAAAIACASAMIYFVVYHLILLPRYHVPTNRLATNNESNVSPQRVFHDERSRKGYFRY